MAASASQSESQQSTQTISTEGAAGASSPTIVAQGNVSYNPPEVSTAAIGAAYNEVLAALAGNQSLNQQVAQQGAQQQSNSLELQQALLQQEQQFASAQVTPQPTTQQNDVEKYLIFGGIGLGAVLLLAIFASK